MGPAAAPTNLLPRNTNGRRSPAEAVTPRRHGRYLGEAGKTSSGVPMSRSARTACWPSRRAWSSTAFSRFSPPSRRWFLCMDCSQVLPRSAIELSFLAGIFPQGAVDILREQIGRLTAGSGAKLGFGFIFGLAVALWSANAGMKAIMDALNVVYEEKEKRGFIKLNLVSLAFTIAAIVSVLLALGAVVVLPVALSYLGLQNLTGLLFRLARWPLLLLIVIFGLAVLYRYGPSRREPRWQWISVGSAFAAVAWLISSALLSWYLASFADYNATYGSLGAGIGMMMWMWISAIVILFGAQLNSEIEHQTARDSTVQGEKPLGARGAVMADTVGKAQ